MATRHPFGGGLSDWVFTRTDDIDGPQPVFAGGALLQAFNARDGGTEYTDLTLDAAGTTPAGVLVSSDGTDGYEVGDIPVFYGPPDVVFLWLSADGGPRRLLGAIDSADLAGQALTGLTQHVAAQNPHGTTVGTLADVSIPEPGTRASGAFLAWDAVSSSFVLISGTGLNPGDFVKTIGGSEIRIPDGNVVTPGQTIRIPAGDRSVAPDTFRTYLNIGTNSSPVWHEVFWLASTGEPRARASANTRVALRLQRFSGASTADILQLVNEADTPIMWVTANGSVRAPNLSTSASFTKAGAVVSGVGRFVWFNTAAVPVTLTRLIFWAGTAGTTATTFDINLDGTTLYPSGKPVLAANAQSSGIITAALAIPPGGRVSVDVDVAGAGLEDLTCQLSFL